MKYNSSFIILSNIRFHANHGVLEQERLTGGDFTVSLRAGYNIETAMRSDRVEDTLNYAALYEIIKREMLKPSRLIENVAYRIAESIFAELPGVESLDITVTKQNPPMGGSMDGASVELHLIKQ